MGPSVLGEGVLEVLEDGHGTGIDALLGRTVQRHEVTEEHQVEQLRQRPLALGHHLVDVGHDLVEQRR